MATTKASFLSTAEVAAKLKISQRRVNALIKSKLLAAETIGGAHVITADEFESYRRRRRGTGRPPKK